uniref:Uncharacterized protein n=1 Tax=Avena sativa TaxID=4498 RepID=A0ACD5ZGT1_AVESA
MFAWRLARDSLALRSNLTGRGMRLENKKCVICGREEEEGAHLFLRCGAVKEVWKEMNLAEVRRNLKRCAATRDVLDELWKLKETQRVEIIALWWTWWNLRNKVREGAAMIHASEVAVRVRILAADCLMFCKSERKIPWP